jgi:hypothetical protein
MSFHLTESKKRNPANDGPAYKVGDVVRRKEVDATGRKDIRPFYDFVIVGFDKDDTVRMCRPFAFALDAGLANPRVAVSYETLDRVSVDVLDGYYYKVGTAFNLKE